MRAAQLVRAAGGIARMPTRAMQPVTSPCCSAASAQAAARLSSGAAALRQPATSRQGGRALHRSAGVCMAAGKQVEVAHILVAPEQKALIPQLRRRILDGEATLAELAAEHSTCPSRSNGGSIGWISRGQTVPEFEEAAYSTAVGGLAMAETRFGVHLLTVTGEREATEVAHITPQELAESLAARTAGANEDVQYLDVREEAEEDMARLPHFQLLPLSRFEVWSPQIHQLLDKGKPTIVLCHHGVRSLQMSKYLITQGFSDVSNVTGGIAGYSLAVDSSIPQY